MKYVFNTNMIDGGDVGDVGTDPYVSVINPPVSNIPIYAYKGDNGQMVPVKIFDGTEYISGGGQPDAGSWSDYREVMQQSLIEQAIADGSRPKIYIVMFQVKCHTVHLVSIILLVSMVLMYLVQMMVMVIIYIQI